jgi:uncharacterized protein
MQLFVFTIVTLGILIVLTIAAYCHSYTMIHFRPQGEKTPAIEALSRRKRLAVLFTGISLPRPLNGQTPKEIGITYTVHTYPGLTGMRLEGWLLHNDMGRGTVILFHGYSKSKSSLLEEASLFYNLGYSAFLVDFRGAGGSEGTYTSMGYYEAEDVVATVRYVSSIQNNPFYILYGQSMGSVAILRAFHLARLSPAGIILECPFTTLLSTIAHRFHSMGLPAFPFAHLLVFWGGFQLGFNGFHHNPCEYAKDVRCNCLILHGEKDARVTVPEIDAIYHNLSGPRSLHTFHGLSHEAYYPQRPEEYRSVTTDWLETLPRSS